MGHDDQDGKGKGTQLIDRSIAILNTLGEFGERGARSADIAQALGLTQPTAHRIISALERHGLIEREEATKRYRLGLALFALGAKAADGTGLRQVAHPSLLRLAHETKDTVFLMARNGFDCVCVDRQQGDYVISSLTGQVGGQIPLGVGPASQAILAFLASEQIDAILDANSTQYPAFNGLSRDQVAEALPQIRQRGYAIDQDRLVEGISALAMPIRAPGRDVVGSLAINMTSARLKPDRLESLLASLSREVERIGEAVNPLSVDVAV
ncbi:MAG: IclR family transcriptional regulator [Minwuiales bacterium]|nr:IclR family transcriptional regulator [Minwuiales bacterium]